jgi:plasmid stabilization system protein ParE
MTTYRVILLRRAERDAEAIADWLTKRSPAGALRWQEAFAAAVEKLAESPMACSEAPERLRPAVDLRQILFKTRKGKYYRAVFVIADRTVRVLRVRSPHQRLMRRRDLPGL